MLKKNLHQLHCVIVKTSEPYFNMFMNNSLKIFIFAYWHDYRWKKFVGASVKIWDLAKNLQSYGNEVTLFLPKYKFDTSDIEFKVIEVPFIDFPVVRNISFNIALLYILITKFFSKKGDILYVRRMTSIIPLIYAKIFNIAFFYEINDDPYNLLYNHGFEVKFKAKALLSTKIDELNLKLCDMAFIISSNLLDRITKKNPKIKTKKLVVTPSGTNTQLFYPRNKLECRFFLNLDLKSKYIGFVGSLLKHQGVNKLIQAAPKILNSSSDCKFIIIGEGPMKEKWITMVQHQGLTSSFLFTGQIKYEDVAIWLGAMDICVAPFLKEAGLRSPVKLFDYMACGKPVVASKIPGSTCMFEDSGAVKLIKPEEPEILADAIIDLIADDKKAQNMGERGLKIAAEKYDRKLIAQKISELARRILKN